MSSLNLNLQQGEWKSFGVSVSGVLSANDNTKIVKLSKFNNKTKLYEKISPREVNGIPTNDYLVAPYLGYFVTVERISGTDGPLDLVVQSLLGGVLPPTQPEITAGTLYHAGWNSPQSGSGCGGAWRFMEDAQGDGTLIFHTPNDDGIELPDLASVYNVTWYLFVKKDEGDDISEKGREAIDNGDCTPCSWYYQRMGGDNFQKRVNPVPKKIPTNTITNDTGDLVHNGVVGEHYYRDSPAPQPASS